MTVPTTVSSVSYTGTGLVSVYAYTFRILQSSDLLVTYTTALGVVSTLVENTDYTVDGVLSYTGGNVTLLAGALASGAVVNFTRAPEEVQDTSLQSQGAYDAKVVETGLDLLTMICQWLQNQVSRALVVPPGTTPITLPDPSALDLLQWNAAADGLQNLPLADLSPILLSGNFIVDRPAFTAGVTAAVTLTQAPGTVNNTLVAFDGVYQQKNTYSVSGLTLTFDAVIPVGVLSVEVTQSAVLPLAIPADNSVSTAAMQNGSVTAAKIAAGAVQTAGIGDSQVTTAKIPDAAVTPAKVSSAVPQLGKNAAINGSMIVATRPDYVASVTGTFGYGKVDRIKGAIVASAVAGTLTQGTGSSLGRTGYTSRWTSLTTTGATTLKWRTFLEKRDASRFKNQTATISAQARHDAPFNRAYTINVYKADAADDFTTMTLIAAGPTIQVPQSTNTALYSRAIAMGDCTNGICIEVVAVSNVSLTGKTFDLAELQIEYGAVESDFEFRDTASEAARCQRYYNAIDYSGIAIATVGDNTTTMISQSMAFPVRMRAAPTAAGPAFGVIAYVPPNTAATGTSVTATVDHWQVQVSDSVAGIVANKAYLLSFTGTVTYTFDADF